MSPNTRIILEGLEAADDLLLTLKLLVNEHLRKKPKLCEHVKGLVKEGRRKVHEALREAVALDRCTTRNRKDQDYE